MATLRIVWYPCNECKSEGLSDDDLREIKTTRYVLMTEGRHCTLDLCATHDAPLLTLMNLKPPARYPRRKTARQRKLPSTSATKRKGGK